ncbi:MAG: DNA double-strand break repair nuclease NurA [Archaeoglobus sp.]|nr:DNA double-strand break repair nuclease NurA [Archaeoglobus sp.]
MGDIGNGGISDTESFKGKVFESRVFDSIPILLRFVGSLKPQPLEVEKRAIEVGAKKHWHLNILNGKRIVGVDGSQLRHLREFGIPFGAVQVAKFNVVHGERDYSVAFKSKWVGLESNLDLERFNLELEALFEEMGGESYLFYDGSFVLSFVSQLRRDLREKYIDAINLLLKKSKETSTPLFGFVEKSYARDIARDIAEVYYDALALTETLKPLEYTEPRICEREVAKAYKEKVCFSYLSLNRFSPVRVEYPEWMVDRIDEFMKVVAAECMVGSTKNYPYVLERAHRYAVIREAEREAIGRIFSKISGSTGSLKWISKRI